MTGGRDMPWLQDTNEVNVAVSWGANYRDVVILDAWNRPLDPPFNLTALDLANKANREALKTRLRQAAVLVDADNDGIGDDWEERHFTTLDRNGESDPDKDRENNLMEYACGSGPENGGSVPLFSTMMVASEQGSFFSMSFRRRLGVAGGLKYRLEWSEGGRVWTDASGAMTLSQIENPYDGTGTEVVTYTFVNPSGGTAVFRVQVGF